MIKNIFPLIVCMLLILPTLALGQNPETERHSKETTDAVGPQATRDVSPKIGLALSGGGARGFAHIGVLKVLRDIGMPIDYVAGTSMGSIVGGLYAAGYPVDELEEVLNTIDWEGIFSDTPPREMWTFLKKRQSTKYLFDLGFTQKGFSLPTGITSGQKISTLFSFLSLPVSDIEHFDDFPIPFRAVAADIGTGEEVVLERGSLAEAMRASMSVPGMFTPVEIDGHLLVDGGVVNNLPVNILKEMGADIVIAVDVSSKLVDPEHLNNPVAVLNQMIRLQMENVTKTQYQLADVVIVTNLEDYGAANFDKGKEICELGKQSAIEKIDELNSLLDRIRETRPLNRTDSDSILQQLQGLYVEDIVIREQGKPYKKTFVQRYFKQQQKKPLDLEKIQQAVTTLFSSGNYESIKFSITKGKEEYGRVLNLDLKKKTEQPHLLRVGMYYEGRNDTPELDKMVFLLNATFKDLTGSGSFWSTDFEFVNVNKLHTQYFQPLGKYLFLLTHVYGSDDFQVVYEGQTSIARYDLNEAGLELSLGVLLSRFGDLTLGYKLEWVEAMPSDVVDPELFPSFDEVLSSLLVRLNIDQLDRYPFPHSGRLFKLEYQLFSDDLGSDADFQKLSAEYRHYFPLAAKHTLGTRFLLGTDFNTELWPYKDFLVGGRDSFVGYKVEEVRGTSIGVAGLEYRYKFGAFPTPIGGDMYMTLTGNIGHIRHWFDDPQEHTDLRYGGAVGIGIDTFLGPVRADYSLGDEGRELFYVNIGFKF